MSLNIPSKDRYDAKIRQVRDLFEETIPNVSRSIGSVLYEWVVRPVSIAYASVEEAIDNLHKSNTLRAYTDSSNTEPNQVDDIVANYFVERRGATTSEGILTVYSTTSRTTVQDGSLFTVSDITVSVNGTVQGVYPDIEGYVNTNQVTYVKAYKVGDLFCFNVPVSTVDQISAIIPAGVTAEAQTLVPGLDHAVLTSPLEGGSAGETDAELISRARTTVCSWAGGSDAIHKLLLKSGYGVYSSHSFDSNDPEMIRTAGTKLFVGSSGMIDTYVKTSQFPLKGVIEVTSSSADLTSMLPAGVISIDRVYTPSEDVDYAVVWGSSDESKASAAGARFSCLQTVDLDIKADGPVFVEYTYMPLISELQEYVSRKDIRPLGIDILIKAAIPAVITIRGSLATGVQDTQPIIKAVKDFINSRPVGHARLDMADINKYLSDNINGVYISNPTHMLSESIGITAETLDPSIDVVNTTAGLIELTNAGLISPQMKFMCISDLGVVIE